MLKHKLKILFLLMLLPVINCMAATKVINYNVTVTNNTHIIFNLTAPTTYRTFSLRNPTRFIIDIKNAKLATKLNKPISTKSAVKRIRYGHHQDKLRIVLDLKKPMKFRVRLVNKQLIIDSDEKIQIYKKPTVTLPQHTKLRNIVVIIDPGHGGKDTGAIGVHGTYEKNVVLAIAKDLQQQLNVQYGFHAILTRTGNYFIPLRKRLIIARKDHGDMFIAIHADAYKNPNSKGASVFALSLEGATSEAARWLAQRENESELGTVLADKNKTLRSVLIDLAQTAAISTSLKIGAAIIQQLNTITDLHNDFVEQAAFVVLKEPDMPSLLVETGFLSNAEEELKLRDPAYQEKIAWALMLGIRNYFEQHPPAGTYLKEKQ